MDATRLLAYLRVVSPRSIGLEGRPDLANSSRVDRLCTLKCYQPIPIPQSEARLDAVAERLWRGGSEGVDPLADQWADTFVERYIGQLVKLSRECG